MSPGRSSDRPRRYCRWLLALALAGAGTLAAAGPRSQEGTPFMRYFSPRDYHGGTQCLSATQDRNGVMYVGSLGLILEYDGSMWRKIDVDSNWVSGLAYDPRTDTVFVGAQNNLGFLKTEPGGTRTFVSLLDQLPSDARDVGAVFGVYVTPEEVFFVGTHAVMRWRGGRFHTWDLPATSKLESSWAAGALYVSSPEVGLLRLEGDALVPVSDDGLFRRAGLRGLVAEPDGSLLLGTKSEGLFVLRAGVVRPLECECGAFLKQAGIYGLQRLRDGSLAVATDASGLVVLDAAHRFRSRLDESSGLQGKTIHCLFEDAEGGLWMGLQSGVARAEIDSPLSVLRTEPVADMSSAYCVGRWLDGTVVGSHAGLYRLVSADPAAAVSAHLAWLPGTSLFATELCTVENGLLAVTKGKLFLLGADARLTPVADEINEVQDVIASRTTPGRVYVIDEKSRVLTLRLDAATGGWVSDGAAVDLGARGGVFSLKESARGDLWVGTTEHGVFRVEFAADGPARVTPFLDRPGPLRGCRDAMVCSGGGPPRFRAARQVCGLDASGREPRAAAEFGERFCDGSYNLGEVMSYDADSLWLTATDVRDPTGNSLRGRARAGSEGGTPTFRSLPHKVEEIIGRPTMYHPLDLPPAPLTTLLLVGTTGSEIVRLDVPRWDALPPPRPFATLVRRAVAARMPILNAPLPYARNSAHFEFAAGTMAFGAAPQFQTRLVNFGASEWSDWSERASADYLNLPEGAYTFEVRARNADGQLGRVGSLAFRVLPPWQRAPWAYTVYGLAAAAVLWALIRWRGRQLLRRNTVLEALVNARTGELRAREADLLANEHNLVRARDDAETANRAKSAFLANMSHELRTPLNAILGYAQILLKQADLPVRAREQVGVIGQSGGHLLSLINEVLDLSKIEAGKLTLSRTDFSLSQLLNEVDATFGPRFAEKRLSFTQVRAPGLPPVVRTDPSRLRQVLFNLLSNAVKFTRAGDVTLSVRPAEAGRVHFEVADTGVGIDPEQLRHIFLAFHQAGESSLAAQGTGLGLAISQRLVDLLGGRIEVASTPGQGSRFWFELPLPSVEQPGGTPHELSEPTQGRITGYEGTPRRLLLVDDLAENRRVLRDFLQPLGFEIEEAANGTDCLASCARQLPDGVLLDLRIGAPDGFEVARTLRTRTGGRPLGIVAISASVFESDRQQAIDAGCDDFLPKPFEEAQLLGMLGRVLGLRWVRAVLTTAAAISVDPPPATGEERPAPQVEARALLELSLRGDIVGIRRRLDALRTAGVSDDLAVLVRRLEPLVATYQMEEIHALLLTVQSYEGP